MERDRWRGEESRSHMTKHYHDNSHHTDTFEKLCNDIFALNYNIRFAGVIDTMGKLVAGGMRHGLKSMEDNENSQKLYVEFALRSVMREEFDEKFGKTIYTFSEREKIKLASFPLDDRHILRVSIEKEEPHHNQIIENILEIISNNKSIGLD